MPALIPKGEENGKTHYAVQWLQCTRCGGPIEQDTHGEGYTHRCLICNQHFKLPKDTIC